MNVILLCNDTIYAKAFSTRIHSSGVTLKAILVEQKKGPFGLKKILIHLLTAKYFLKISNFLKPTIEKEVLLQERLMRQSVRNSFQKTTRCNNRWADGVKVHFVDTINSEYIEDVIRDINPDFGFVFGTRILKENIIRASNDRLINFHSSLLPAYRGFFPEFWQLLDDSKETRGFTFHLIDSQVDTGDVLYQQRVDYHGNNPFFLRMMNILAAYEIIPHFIKCYLTNQIVPQKQPVNSRLNHYKDFRISLRHKYYMQLLNEKSGKLETH